MEPSGVAVPATPKRTRTLALAATVVLAIGACQPGATSAPPSTAAAPSATPPTEQPTEAAPALFHIVGDAPVIERSIVPDRNAILPAAVAVDAGGTYHAWVVAFGAAPGTHDLHHLTSTDAVTWTVQLDDSLAGLSEGLGDPGAFPTSVFEDGDGWAMYLSGALESEPEGWEIWRATAPGPDGPWTRDGAPVLERGPEGAWDSGGLDFPGVIPLAEGGYAMFYSAVPAMDRTTGAIGRATSEDGIEWTKDDGPVVQPGLCGGFDASAVHQPRVVSSADNTTMAYVGYPGGDAPPQVGYADSLDEGATWGCEWQGPALGTDGLPEGQVHTIATFQRGDRRALLVEWLSGGGTDVWLAQLGFGG